MIKKKSILLLVSTILTLIYSFTSFAYTKADTIVNGIWRQGEDNEWYYEERKWDKDGKEYMQSAQGVCIINGTVYEFTDNGKFINKNQKYYKDKFDELLKAMNQMNEIINMPNIAVEDSQGFWAAFNNRICGSSSGVQFLTGDKLNCTNLDELKYACDKYSSFSGAASSYISNIWNKYDGAKDKKGNRRSLESASLDEILSLIKKDINESCVVIKEGSRPAYVFTGSSSINSRDVSVAVAEALCRIDIPAVTCSSIETGSLYVCVYDIDKGVWKWCDFTREGSSYSLEYIPPDLVYYY